MKTPPPPKNYALACWWLTYRLPVEYEPVEAYTSQAERHARMPIGTFTVCTARWPKPWHRMKAKREMRLAYLRQTGQHPPDGWAPLPGDGRSRNVPALAQRRQHSAFLKRIAAYGR